MLEPSRKSTLLAVLIGTFVCLSCNKPPSSTPPESASKPRKHGEIAAKKRPREREPTAPSVATQGPVGAGPRTILASPSNAVDLVSGVAAGGLQAVIADEIALASRADRRCIVYVGAPWCEPCKRFKAALVAGELDAQLKGFRFIELDADLDKQRLADAGYSMTLVPFFAAPTPLGGNSGRTTAGVPNKDSPMAPLAKRVAALAVTKVP